MYNFTEKQKIEILARANKNLLELHPSESAITLNDIESKYRLNPLSMEADAKTRKGSKEGYLTGVLYLASASLAGINVCPFASKGCIESCLLYAGRGKMKNVTKARIGKTLALFFDFDRYVLSIDKGIKSLITKAKNKNMIPIVRLNGTSDLRFEKTTNLMVKYSKIQFYDYTKNLRAIKDNRLDNYHLTFSASESNLSEWLQVLSNRYNVAMVFNEVPKIYGGFKVIDGDKTDLRFLDKGNGVIIGLKAKGLAKNDESGFVKVIG